MDALVDQKDFFIVTLMYQPDIIKIIYLRGFSFRGEVKHGNVGKSVYTNTERT
ncbi:hypothetical protein SOASR016_03420 [Pectobacterium carotovorum subsp. carotovorum]|uniref:Uncharacterized protein n=1 Tax=Pectobacterium carotovorum subsp. carotovorum TaxID=555 RepID=A0ABQ5L109_PECCC|nr:hypothetical protein SOASR016_03420 [Pectobacterium carotovorum subsp. carotovorum]